MNGRVILLAIVLLSTSLVCGAKFFTSIVTQSTTYVYPDNFPSKTLQEAIWNVTDGDTIVVRQGTYYNVHLNVNKSITLEGFDRYTTILDGSGNGTVITVNAGNVRIFEFTIQHGNLYGIRVNSTSNCNVSRNVIRDNVNGIGILYSCYCTLKDNDIKYNRYNFGVSGSRLENFIHDIDVSNKVDEKPVYYWVNQTDKTIPSNAGYVAVVNSSNILVEKLQLTSNWQGVLIAYSTNVTIQNLELAYPLVDFQFGVQLISTANSTVQNITVSHYFEWSIAIQLQGSKNNTIKNNKLSTRYDIGGVTCCIELAYSDCNCIIDNIITKGTPGVGYHVGICLQYSHKNEIAGNNITTWAQDEYDAIWFLRSNGTIIYHNNFLDDAPRIWNDTLSFNTKWDNGLEGNYWKDYKGKDDGSGGRIRGDGIGDTLIPHHGLDHYPLMDPWSAWRTFSRNVTNAFIVQKLFTFSNSTLASFHFNRNLNQISLIATCGHNGFLNIIIPRSWTDAPFTTRVDGAIVNSNIVQNSTHSSIYITCQKGCHTIEIIGTELGNIIGDLDGDGKVTLVDLVLLCRNYGAKEGS
jgi:parallel beta-helix repeat protein